MPNNIFRTADLMGIPRVEAVATRIKEISAEIDEWLTGHVCSFARYQVKQLQDEIYYLKNRLRDQPEMVTTEQITRAMIESAKRYPLEDLMEFNRMGQAVAFCHADTSPSLYLYRESNTCFCFVCHENFDPLRVLMERDGVSFVDAVKQLA